MSILASRILGYVRDAVLSWQFGADAATDAYHAAFVLPDMLNYFLAGGALSLAFLPAFTKLEETGESSRAWRLFWSVALTTAALLTAGIAVAWMFTDQVITQMYPGFNAEQHQLTVELTRIVLPGPLFFAIGGLFNATELARKRFTAAAISPLLYNLCIVAGGTLAAPWLGIAGFSWGVILGAILGPFATAVWLARDHTRLVAPLSPANGAVLAYWWTAFPLLVGVSLTTVDEWLGRWAASTLEPGSITWLNNARRLMLVPVALVGQSVSTAALPFLASLHARKDDAGFDRTVSDAAQLTWTVGVTAAACLHIGAHLAISVLYGHGSYSAEDVTRTASILQILCLAIPAWCVQAVVARTFYARSQMWAPMILTTLVVLCVVPLYAWAGRSDVVMIAWATVAGTWASSLSLALLSLRVTGGFWGATLTSLPSAVAGVTPGLLLWHLIGTRLTGAEQIALVFVSATLCSLALASNTSGRRWARARLGRFLPR
jgi:putative peptidoglycan lipid II flippase